MLHIGKSTVYRNIETLVDNKILALEAEGDRRNRIAAKYVYLPAFERCSEIVPVSTQRHEYTPAAHLKSRAAGSGCT